MAIAGLICGIAALLFSIIGPFVSYILCPIALPAAIVGLVLSVKAGKAAPSGVAKAGTIIGIIAVVLGSIAFLFCGLCGLCAQVALCTAADAASKVVGA